MAKLSKGAIKMSVYKTSQCLVARIIPETGAGEKGMKQTRGLKGLESSVGARRIQGLGRNHERLLLSN